MAKEMPAGSDVDSAGLSRRRDTPELSNRLDDGISNWRKEPF
jgi:hypothetical protein